MDPQSHPLDMESQARSLAFLVLRALFRSLRADLREFMSVNPELDGGLVLHLNACTGIQQFFRQFQRFAMMTIFKGKLDGEADIHVPVAILPEQKVQCMLLVITPGVHRQGIYSLDESRVDHIASFRQIQEGVLDLDGLPHFDFGSQLGRLARNGGSIVEVIAKTTETVTNVKRPPSPKPSTRVFLSIGRHSIQAGCL